MIWYWKSQTTFDKAEFKKGNEPIDRTKACTDYLTTTEMKLLEDPPYIPCNFASFLHETVFQRQRSFGRSCSSIVFGFASKTFTLRFVLAYKDRVILRKSFSFDSLAISHGDIKKAPLIEKK